MEDRRSLINVRDVLEKNSYTASLEDLRSKGRTQVRIVRADQIASLIEEAVLRILGERKSTEEVEALVGRSKEEFRRLLESRERELKESRERLGELERVRAEHRVLVTENERLRKEREEGVALLLGRLQERLERIGRKVGVGAVVEEEPVNLGAIFGAQPELESNLENVDVKEQRTGGIAGAVEKARSLRRKEGTK